MTVSIDTSRRAKAALKAHLGHPAWLRGLGIGHDARGPILRVNVATAADRRRVPTRVGGVPVQTTVVGRVRANPWDIDELEAQIAQNRVRPVLAQYLRNLPIAIVDCIGTERLWSLQYSAAKDNALFWFLLNQTIQQIVPATMEQAGVDATALRVYHTIDESMISVEIDRFNRMSLALSRAVSRAVADAPLWIRIALQRCRYDVRSATRRLAWVAEDAPHDAVLTVLEEALDSLS